MLSFVAVNIYVMSKEYFVHLSIYCYLYYLAMVKPLIDRQVHSAPSRCTSGAECRVEQEGSARMHASMGLMDNSYNTERQSDH